MKTLFHQELPIGHFLTFDEKPGPSVCVHQTHSKIVLNYNGSDLSSTEADGIIIDIKHTDNIWPTVKTADCLPICLIGPNQVAMIHAGWRGVATKILIAPEVKKIRPYYAFIGPSIQSENFEVTKEFYAHFPGSPNFLEKNGRITFNLQQEVILQLKTTYPEITVVDSEVCTYANITLNSFRRDQSTSRNWNIFRLNR